MKFNSLSLQDMAPQAAPQPTKPGMELIKSVMIHPGGSNFNTAITAAIVDAPEATFAKYRRFYFQFSSLGTNSSTAFQPTINLRRNGTSTGGTQYWQTTSVSGSSVTLYGTGTGTAIPVTPASSMTNIYVLRNLDIYVDQYGCDIQSYFGSQGTSHYAGTIATTSMSFGGTQQGLATYGLGYYLSDFPGIQLNFGGNGITPPNYNGNASTYSQEPVWCDVYGYTIK